MKRTRLVFMGCLFILVIMGLLLLTGQMGPGGYTGEGEVLIFKGSASVPTNVLPPGSTPPEGPPTSYLAQPLLGTKNFRGEKAAVFGLALACGDINADGYKDLIVGAPGASPIGVNGAGMAFIFYGSPSGWPSNISPPGSSHPGGPRTTYLALPIPGITAFRGEAGARFGSRAAVGDFNGDGVGDVAISAPGYFEGRGIIVIFYGEREIGIADDILAPGNPIPPTGKVDYLMMPFVESDNFRGEPGTGFGNAIACGDVDRDGFADLIAGTPGASVIGVKNAGLVHIFYGASSGIASNVAPAGNPIPSGGRKTVLAQAILGTNSFRGEEGGHFGGQVAAGDIDGDGFADVIAAAPDAGPIGVGGAGLVEIFPGASGGIRDNISPPGIPLPDPGVRSFLVQPWIENSERRLYPGASFGAALAAGDVNGDGIGDLAAGAPNTSVIGVGGSGAVCLFYGSPGGIPGNIGPAGTPNPPNPPYSVLVQPWIESDTKRSYPGAHFGSALAIGDVTGDRRADLIVGSPESPVIGIENAGIVILWPGNSSGIASNIGPPGSEAPKGGPYTLLTQPPFKAQRGEKDAHFGIAVVAGDANRDGFDDIAAGLTGNVVAGPEGVETPGLVTSIPVGPGGHRKSCLDLIFVIDLTSSMSDDIDMVKKTAKQILNTIAGGFPDFRVAIVGYRDWTDSEMFRDVPFSNSIAAITAAIDGLKVQGGGDEPEAVLEALLRAIRTENIGPWRDGCNKQIILMGDAPPHSPIPQGPDKGKTADDVVAAAEKVDPAVINSILIAKSPGSFSEEARKAFEDLSVRTKGTTTTADKAEEVPIKMMDMVEVIRKTGAVPPSGTGGGGGMVLPSTGVGTPLIIALALLGACLILAIAILAIRRRGAGTGEVVGVRVDAALNVTYADGGTKAFRITGARTTIGRGADNHVILHDSEVSTRHAEIVASPAGFLLRDLGSANGTTLNGRPVAEAYLNVGDEIGIGTTRLVFGA